ncbi:MAG: kynureninase, partial [Glaciecola sp.]
VASITEAAHAVGALTIWDTAHSAGALALALDDWGVDFAVGCSYKFLNAGPGGPAWIYVGPHLHDSAQNPLAGWFGHAAPFDFSPGWTPAPGAERFRSGTPAVLSFVGFEESLLAIEGVDPALVEAKAGALTEALLDHLTSAGAFDVGGLFEATGVELVTPLAAADRGAQVSLRMTHAWPVVRALAERGVIGDHRPPDLVRLGFAPLVTRFADASAGAQALLDILATESWRDARFRPRTVVP